MKDVYSFEDLRDWSRHGADGGAPIRLGVFGDPVAHSLSPQMQNAALAACDLQMRYARFRVLPDELEPALRLLPSLGFVGVNLTVPHKIRAAALMDDLDDFAQQVAAVNTVRVEGEKLIGFNTDGPGFSTAIESAFGATLGDLRVLLLGVGGVGRAIAMQCARAGCRRLTLVNRTLENAAGLAQAIRSRAELTKVEAVEWTDDTALRAAVTSTDLIVNATSLGMSESDDPVFNPLLLRSELMVYDTVYAPSPTALLRAAADAGARGADGHSLLLHQGALAFETWFDQSAPVAEMRAAICSAR